MRRKLLAAGIFAAGLLCGCRTAYLLSNVESGEVGGKTTLRNRYRITSCEVTRLDDRGWFWDSKLRTVVIRKEVAADALPELAAMYPGVFADGKDAIGVAVSIRVTGTDADGAKARCAVAVRNAETGKPLGDESFCIESREVNEEELAALHDLQSCRARHVDNAYKKTVVEGFAGAVAAALERAENGGTRKSADSKAPQYVMPVAPVERPF